MTDYAKLQATATRILREKGKACTLRKRTAGTYSASNGSATVTTSDVSMVGVLLNYAMSTVNAAGSLIEATDKKAIIQGDVSPDIDDQLIFNSVTYRIVAIKTVAPAGTAVIHECQVRI